MRAPSRGARRIDVQTLGPKPKAYLRVALSSLSAGKQSLDHLNNGCDSSFMIGSSPSSYCKESGLAITFLQHFS